MRVPYQWLQELVAVDWHPGELAARLTMAGIAVENVLYPGTGLEQVLVGVVLAVKPHPEADQLAVCRVSTGRDVVTVVCGAPNVSAGQRVALALPGTRLPGGMSVAKAVIRGQESQGMICSQRELGAGPDHAGILVLGEAADPGSQVAPLLGLDSPVLVMDLTPNRPDCFSMWGIAREVAAISGAPLNLRQPVAWNEQSQLTTVAITIANQELCPRYSAAFFQDLIPGKSPEWMQQRLWAAGVRPINNMVDVTNYVMLELGQPLHAFDLARLQGPRIEVRLARQGETIITLDGVNRLLDEQALVIADDLVPVAIAGVMGGLESEVTEQTTTVVMESANFSGSSVRRTSRSLGLRTEASGRFERGVNREGTVAALWRAAELLQQSGAAKPAGLVMDRYPLPWQPTTIELSPNRVNDLLGTQLTAGKMRDYLDRLQLQSAATNGLFQVKIPSYRLDLNEPIDLVEEVARLHGFDRIETTVPAGVLTEGKVPPRVALEQTCRKALTSAGLTEVITYSFIDPREFDRLGLSPGHPDRRAVSLKNPLSEEQGVMRTTLLPGLMRVAVYNLGRQRETVTVYEVGRVYSPQGDTLPREQLRAGILVSGEIQPGWKWPAHRIDFYWLKGVVERLLAHLQLPTALWHKLQAALPWHPGRVAELEVAGQIMGVMGEIHPDILEAYGLTQRVWLAELEVERVLELARQERRYRPVSRYPAVLRDLAVVVHQQINAAGVSSVIAATAGELLQSCKLFDVYQGPQVPEGRQSMAYSLEFQSPDCTLTDLEVDAVLETIKQALAGEFGAQFRQ